LSTRYVDEVYNAIDVGSVHQPHPTVLIDCAGVRSIPVNVQAQAVLRARLRCFRCLSRKTVLSENRVTLFQLASW